MKIDDKLKRFEAAVQKEADRERNALLKELDSVKTSELSRAEDAVLTNAYEMIQSEVAELSAETQKEISIRRLEQKKEYLARRKELEDSVFESVKKRLQDYTKTADYELWLVGKVEEFSREMALDNTVFQIGRGDRHMEARILMTYGLPCKVEVTDSVEIGGIIYVNRANGYVIDASLDAILNDQRDWFRGVMAVPQVGG